MYKKEIKESIKEFNKAVDENTADLKALDVLNPTPTQYKQLEYTQEYIQNNVNLYTKEKAYNIPLENGPYKCTYTLNGSHMLVSNSDGYLSAFNTQNFGLCFETNLDDRIYDTKWLHNELYCAVAQEDCLFVYDNTGKELHTVREMRNPRHLEFLPYHFLLAGTSTNGYLNYLDTSVGEVISKVFVGDKAPMTIKANPTNGVIHMGSKTGQVSLWSPSQKSYLMKVKCHKASINCIEVDRTGTNMITTGNDNRINVFDIRNMYKPLKSIPSKTNVHFTSLSQRNLLAIGYSDKIAILKDYKDLYMKHRAPGIISSLSFCNHEDVLSIGYSKGFASIIVPGSGDPTYDNNECSPFTTVKERRNQEVKRLLEKIPADMIGIKSAIGHVESKKKDFEPEAKKEEKVKNALSRFYEN